MRARRRRIAAAAGTFTSTQPSANALTQVVLRSKNKEI
jgi:hypothetical protein